MKFKFLTGDMNWQRYGGKFISSKLNNGDWNYYLVLNVINLEDYDYPDRDKDIYEVSIQAISPEAAGKENLDKAIGCCGFDDEFLEKYGNNPEIQVEALSTYGISAQLWNKSGRNINKLLSEAKQESKIIEGLFGFYMDRYQNGIGQTGWNCISGQDLKTFFATRKS